MPVSAVCVGESMALFVPADGQPAEAARSWTRTVGGAESNVAIHLARLGVRARWVSAVGGDALGRALLAEIGDHGVDVSAVRVDQHRATGLYLKEPGEHGSPVRYYRRGSAASALGPDLLACGVLDGADLVHLTGITPALSDSCAELVAAVLGRPRPYLVSFDVNHRPALAQDPRLLANLAAAADIVFVGDDEAAALWQVDGVDGARELWPDVPTVVVKHGARGASVDSRGGGRVYCPALRARVLDPVGAGDAFAAGYLDGALRGADPLRCLRGGHLCAVSVLGTAADIGEPLPAGTAEWLLTAGERDWAEALF